MMLNLGFQEDIEWVSLYIFMTITDHEPNSLIMQKRCAKMFIFSYNP